MRAINAEILELALAILVPALVLMALMVWHLHRRQNPSEMNWRKQRKDEARRQERRRRRRDPDK